MSSERCARMDALETQMRDALLSVKEPLYEGAERDNGCPQDCYSTLMVGEGALDADVVIVGAQPDYSGSPMGRKALCNLRTLSSGFVPDDDDDVRDRDGLSVCYLTTALKLRIPGNKRYKATPEELCRHGHWLVKQLLIIRPCVIVALGPAVLRFLLDYNHQTTRSREPLASAYGYRADECNGERYEARLGQSTFPVVCAYSPARLSDGPRWRACVEKGFRAVHVALLAERNRRKSTVKHYFQKAATTTTTVVTAAKPPSSPLPLLPAVGQKRTRVDVEVIVKAGEEVQQNHSNENNAPFSPAAKKQKTSLDCNDWEVVYDQKCRALENLVTAATDYANQVPELERVINLTDGTAVGSENDLRKLRSYKEAYDQALVCAIHFDVVGEHSDYMKGEGEGEAPIPLAFFAARCLPTKDVEELFRSDYVTDSFGDTVEGSGICSYIAHNTDDAYAFQNLPFLVKYVGM